MALQQISALPWNIYFAAINNSNDAKSKKNPPTNIHSFSITVLKQDTTYS